MERYNLIISVGVLYTYQQSVPTRLSNLTVVTVSTATCISTIQSRMVSSAWTSPKQRACFKYSKEKKYVWIYLYNNNIAVNSYEYIVRTFCNSDVVYPGIVKLAQKKLIASLHKNSIYHWLNWTHEIKFYDDKINF